MFSQATCLNADEWGTRMENQNPETILEMQELFSVLNESCDCLSMADRHILCAWSVVEDHPSARVRNILTRVQYIAKMSWRYRQRGGRA